jgi:hypothetical protein
MVSYKSRQYWTRLASSPHPKIPQIAAIQGIIWGTHYNSPYYPTNLGKQVNRRPENVNRVIHKFRLWSTN